MAVPIQMRYNVISQGLGARHGHRCQFNVKAYSDKKSENFSMYRLAFRSPLTHASHSWGKPPRPRWLPLKKGELESCAPFLRGLGDIKRR